MQKASSVLRGPREPLRQGPRGWPTILQVTPELNDGGVERGALEIAEAIVAAGGRALIASQGGRMARRLPEIGAELIEGPYASKNPAVIWANGARLAAVMAAERVDLIHARSRAPAWSALRAARRTGAPFVTTYHGVYNEGPPGKRLYNSVMARGDRVIAISEYVAAIVRERHGVAEDRLRVAPRGADLATFTPEAVAPERVAALRAAWGLDEAGGAAPVVMLPGRLTRWKGQTLFIEAAALLAAARGSGTIVALMVGGEKGADALVGGPFETELRDLIASAGLEADLRLTGPCEDMPAAYALADLVVSASLDPEAFGRVAVEAQAMATPVVASAHGGATETVAQGETGWLFPPGDPEALAAAIGAFLDASPERRAALGAAARARVEARFSIDRMQAATLSIYRELLGADAFSG